MMASHPTSSGQAETATPNYAARNRRREETRERILIKAADFFYRHGIATVSMEDVAAHVGVTKPTLYAHFNSKEALVGAALNRVEASHFSWFERRLAEYVDQGVVPALAPFDVLDLWFKSSIFRGCAYQNASVEVGSTMPDAQIAVLRHKGKTRKWLHDLATISDVPPERCQSLSAHLMLLMEGAIITAFIENDDQAAARAREAAEVLLKDARCQASTT
ncbi:MAG: TetR/AcrR family transcriptional regulator [Pseudonocardia sp.]|uniref:TetR/AcrR family transcriptional regulator n=1 Tax=unclassified Pseudonocardia TaxID=2619320 RepID=UPI001AD41E55|nr:MULTISPECIES: TetR/AcrR family transcriptional regulator [unclassified Pseudonocardia]MBN9112396.1 TetR/AcrR family transcriptional regulator [Pseudonocardia sp.]